MKVIDRKTLDEIWLAQLERIDSNLQFAKAGESKLRQKQLENDARYMVEGINAMYYRLLEELIDLV